ncbi:MAG: hypothetical protein MJ211_09995 [Bacteroidales bacterium]|nr:hypothetical protein [Bacteroidales bacterium]
MFEKLTRIRKYMMKEEYKKDIISYLLEIATQNVGRTGNFQDGMLFIIDAVRKVPERVENERN